MFDRAVDGCDDHTVEEQELRRTCGNLHPITVDVACTNCIFSGRGGVALLLYGHPAVQAFKVGHGHNLVAPSDHQNPLSGHEETILSVDPFAAHVTYRYREDALTLTIDDELTVIELPVE